MPDLSTLSPPRLRLPRACRIKQGRDFERARMQGRRLASGCLIMNWLPVGATEPARLGVVVGRKVGSAVARSRARRLLREAWRRHQHGLAQPLDLVLVARPSIAAKKLAEVDRDFLNALRRAGLLRPKPAPAGESRA